MTTTNPAPALPADRWNLPAYARVTTEAVKTRRASGELDYADREWVVTTPHRVDLAIAAEDWDRETPETDLGRWLSTVELAHDEDLCRDILIAARKTGYRGDLYCPDLDGPVDPWDADAVEMGTMVDVLETVEHDGMVLAVLMTVVTYCGRVAVWAGVPEAHRATAAAAGTTRGMDEVWAGGPSLDSWCPDGLTADEALELVQQPAMAAWRRAQR